MTCGIYKITENETGRCYIGQSKHIERRWIEHGKKYPVHLFSYEVIMECDIEQLDFWEIAWITSERSIEFGFNRTVGGSGFTGRNKGYKHSEESRAKMSALQKGKLLSEETKAKMSATLKGIIPWNKGKKSGLIHSEETKSKMSNRMKGNKNGVGNTNRTGKTASEETKLKMSEAQKTRWRR